MTLTVHNLHVHIHSQPVVHDVSFEVESGTRFGLIGESGSGKSLTALSLLGLLPGEAAARGTVHLEGRPLLPLPEAELARRRGKEISMVFQDPRTSLNPVRRIGDQMTETLRIHERLSRRAARARAVELAQQVQLPEPTTIIDRYPHQLSGGQRQRVGIASAVAARPRLLIADEPTTALDATVQAEILQLFLDLVESSGTSLLFITHDLGVLAQVVTHAAVMSGGRIVERGPVQDLLNRAQHPVTRHLVSAARASQWSGG